MKEKYQEYKHSKKYKFHILINIILFLLFIIIVYCCYLFYVHNDNKNEQVGYSYEIDNNIVLLNNGNTVLTTYNCKSNCEIYQNFFKGGYILLKDGSDIYLYDLVNDKMATSSYTEVYPIFENTGKNVNNIIYFIVKNSNNKYGLIDLKGNTTIPVSYDALGNIADNVVTNYSYKYGFIAAKSGDSWGLLDMETSKGSLDFQYQNIIVTDNNKLAVKENNLWYLVDNNNKKLINTGFDSIYIFTNYLLVTSTNQAYLINDKGVILTNKINLITPVDYFNKTGLKAYMSKNTLRIDLLDPNNEVTASYTYNETTSYLDKI